MKRDDLIKAGISEKAIDGTDIDPTPIVVHEEFHKPNGDYRKNAVNRLIRMQIPFRGECNIISDLVDAVLQVNCPYCHNKMFNHGSSTGGGGATVTFNCHHCSSNLYLSLDTQTGIRLVPNPAGIEDTKRQARKIIRKRSKSGVVRA
jgi:hypothetical protein